MGKIVKYCNSCDEGFAEKFGFCPNCAAPLQAFEMNPLGQEIKKEFLVIKPSVPDVKAIDEINPLELAAQTPAYSDVVLEEEAPLYVQNADVIEYDLADAVAVEPDEVPISVAANTAEIFQPKVAPFDETPARNYEPAKYSRDDDGGYYVTVIQEKTQQRNLLLLGSTFLVLTVAIGATIVSLFQKDLGIGAIGDERSLAYLIEEVPMVVEEDPKPEKDKGGGGGGGGREEKEETSQGDLADQSKTPTRPPNVNTPKMENPMLPPPQTEGNRKFPKEFNRWGDPNSKFAGLSNGVGSGGGQGSGNGTGQGSGNGTGTGSGSGSGSGSGDGTGNGPGTGGGSGVDKPPPPKPVGVTTALKIISKPRATYTDAARTNNVQGSVLVKVTLLASGQIGSVTAVRGLPHGLTERAIAAARQIKFEPKKINGIPQTTIVTFDYGFNIY
ncbi:MAG: energy transducer TonB [Pyrinomonadaceae bacterium]